MNLVVIYNLIVHLTFFGSIGSYYFVGWIILALHWFSPPILLTIVRDILHTNMPNNLTKERKRVEPKKSITFQRILEIKYESVVN